MKFEIYDHASGQSCLFKSFAAAINNYMDLVADPDATQEQKDALEVRYVGASND